MDETNKPASQPRGLAAFETRAAAERGAELQLTTPSGELTDIYIRVIGDDSEEYQRALRRVIDKTTKEMVRKRSFSKSSQQIEQEEIELLVIATKGWRTGQEPTIDDLEGKPLVFNEANVRRMYADFPAIREQVQEFKKERANFLTR